MSLPNPWLPFARPNPDARLRLFCFPFAGGGATAFRPWAHELSPTIEVCPVQPPGRESRFREPAFASMTALVMALADALRTHFERPFAFYGYSMGAIVAFELARELRRRGTGLPTRLIVSGRGAPHLPSRHVQMHALSDDEFRAELRRLRGTPAAVLDNDELMQMVLPTLRADFTAHETYVLADGPPLDCPILAIGGADDDLAPPADLDAWREHTTARFETHILPGDHFFLQTHRPALLQLLARYLESVQPA
jgi:medium-chain acyl-[acyl-carrier-protein] hydrolase